MFDTPILYLIFNRPDLTEITFESIRNVKPKKLFIAADGPRSGNENDELNCIIVRQYVLSKIDWNCEIQTLFRDENLGCGKAVSSAINWFFSQVDEGIILEDDCLPDKSFYKFCSDLLEKYRFDNQVMSISGSNLLGSVSNYSGDSYLWGLGGIWGWATWKRAWLKYDFEMKAFEEINKRKLKSYFKNDISLDFYYCFFEEYFSNKIDTWDIQWIFSIVINNSVCINPTKNLVENLGFGSSATHTVDSKSFISKLISYEMGFPLSHPRKKKLNQKFLNKIIKKNTKQKNIFESFLIKLKSILK
jgi:hypothetical protein